MARLSTAGDIINRVAVEVGLLKDPNPFASQDESFIQLSGLINAAGQELVELHDWQTLKKPFEVTTQAGDSGSYDLPADFDHMIDQTGWDRTNSVAIGGPLSSQDWSYLEGRDLVSQSIYASFRLAGDKFDIYPQPPPEGLLIKFEYISTDWVLQNPSTPSDTVTDSSDVVLYKPLLIQKFLKCKWLEAKNLPSEAARMEFENMFESRAGKDVGASILSASHHSRGLPLLHPYYSTGDTGFGG